MFSNMFDGLIYLLFGAVPFTVGIVFVILRLCGVIDWHWGLVCIPFYVLAVVVFLTREMLR